MSGHSKWASIKHKKGAADAKRGKTFSKLSKAITVSVKEGGPDLAMNFGLRLAIDKAKAANMPKDNIERAIERGKGGSSEGALASAVYEGMGPGGVAIVVEALTDNPNRTIGSLKTIFNKAGGNLDAKVLWMFDRRGVIEIEDVNTLDDHDLFELELIEAGAMDILREGDAILIVTEIPHLHSVASVVEEHQLIPENVGLAYLPKDIIELNGEDIEKLRVFIEKLEEDEDVDSVFINASI